MSENTSSLSNATAVNDAWNRVGEAVNAASSLYLRELNAYLSWARNVQREVLNQTFTTTQELSRLTERQLAFLVRLRENTPAFGTIPKGTETISAMVEGVVKETTGEA